MEAEGEESSAREVRGWMENHSSSRIYTGDSSSEFVWSDDVDKYIRESLLLDDRLVVSQHDTFEERKRKINNLFQEKQEQDLFLWADVDGHYRGYFRSSETGKLYSVDSLKRGIFEVAGAKAISDYERFLSDPSAVYVASKPIMRSASNE